MSSQNAIRKQGPFEITDLVFEKHDPFNPAILNGISSESSAPIQLTIEGGQLPLNIYFKIEQNWWVVPDWLLNAVKKLNELRSFENDWDSYGAPPIKDMFVKMAIEVMLFAMEEKTPEPSIVPIIKGGIQIEWHTKGIDLEIEISAANSIFVSFEDSVEGVSWEGMVPFGDFKNLDEILRTMTKR